MQTENRFFEDFARMASGAVSGLSALRSEMEAQMRQHVETFLGRMNLVRREEFDAAQAMIAKARDEQEALTARLAALEGEIAALKATLGSGPRRRGTRADRHDEEPQG